MMTTAAAPASRPYDAAVARDGSQVPWTLYAIALAATCVVVGVIWDISWHMTIGRDTFWTPAHMCTYAAGAIVGVVCGWTALHTTLRGTPEARALTVGFWGFRAPLGAWIAVWGSFAMLTSAPFDDWWHNAYGLDVKIISPPHTLLVLGMVAIVVGALVWSLSAQNRATDGVARERIAKLFLYAGGMLLSMVAVFVTEYTNGGHQHTSEFYQVSAIAFPFVLVAVARGSTLRWPATAVAAIYMIVRILMGWILPLFPATPRLGPIYNPVDHMVAMQFPLLLIAPALAIDLLGHRYGKATTRTRDWLHAPVYALAFVIALLLVQWPFATFLHSSAAQNWVFFADRVASYGDSRVSLATMQRWFEQRMYQVDGGVAGFWKGIVLAIAYGSLSARLGMAWGRWMRAVQR